MAKTDVAFYSKIRDHAAKAEPEENNISTKTRHLYFTSSDSEGSEGDEGSMAEATGITSDKIQMSSLSSFEIFDDDIPLDLSIKEEELQ